MRLRNVPPAQIVLPLITAHKAGIPLSASQLEAHYLAGGHVQQVVQALISADKANIDLTFERADGHRPRRARRARGGADVRQPEGDRRPPPISAIAKDGIQVRAIARVTVRANIDRLVGGAGEETIIARVGEGIVSTIGSSDTHAGVLENPDHISKTVLAKGLDTGTAFEILSIDIADVDVGENIGAKLQTDQAEADHQVAQAKAEERRADGRRRRAGASRANRRRSPRPRFRRRWPRRSARATSASWTTTTSATSRPIPACATPSGVAVSGTQSL